MVTIFSAFVPTEYVNSDEDHYDGLIRDGGDLPRALPVLAQRMRLDPPSAQHERLRRLRRA